MDIASIIGTNEAAASAAETARETTLGQDDFLRMLITQLENQDPLNPQDSTEFTAQLATFSSLEQLVSINSSIQALGTSSAEPGIAELSALIGREIRAESPQLEVAGVPGETPRFDVMLPFASTETTVEVRNASGRVVRTLDVGALGQGVHSIVWNGLDSGGKPVSPGVYSLHVDARSGTAPVNAATLVTGRVTSVMPAIGGDPALVMMGDIPVTASQIAEIRAAGGGV